MDRKNTLGMDGGSARVVFSKVEISAEESRDKQRLEPTLEELRDKY